jgi:hypothetical protein
MVRVSRIESVSHDLNPDRARELALSEAILCLREASRRKALGQIQESNRLYSRVMEVI